MRALRRVLRLAMEWGEISNAPKIKFLAGENHRERVITRRQNRSILRRLLLCCMTWRLSSSIPECVRRSAIISPGKMWTETRDGTARSWYPWKDQSRAAAPPADTPSGTFLTHLGESGCDAWTLARIAGYSNIAISQRYVHPSGDAVLLAMSRLGGHTEKTALPAAKGEWSSNWRFVSGLDGERGRNRTFNLLIKSQLLCQLSYAPLLWNQSSEGHHRKHYQCNTGLHRQRDA